MENRDRKFGSMNKDAATNRMHPQSTCSRFVATNPPPATLKTKPNWPICRFDPFLCPAEKSGRIVTGSITYEVVTTDEKGELDLSSRTNQIVSPVGNQRRREVTVYPSSLLEDLSGIEREPAPEANTLSESPLINSKHPEIRQLALSLLQQAELTQQSSVTERAIAFQRGIASRVKESPFDRVVSEGHVTLNVGKGIF